MQHLVPSSTKKLTNIILKTSTCLPRANLLNRTLATSSIKLANSSIKFAFYGSCMNSQKFLFKNRHQKNSFDSTIKRFYASSLPEHMKILLPALSPTMEQGSLAKWAKKEGDHVLEGDLIVEIETDKATMGLEATEEGYLAKILVNEKAKDLPLKTLLCIMVKDKSAISAFADYKLTDADRPGAAPAAKQEAPKPAPDQAQPQTTPPPPQSGGGRVIATPLAHRLAAKLNLDLSLVDGTGPDKQIRTQDIRNFIAKTPAEKPQTTKPTKTQTTTPTTGKQEFTDLTINNYRAVTAKRLTQSKQTIPHYYLTIDIELDKALKVRKDLNEQLAKENSKLSVNDLVIKAAALSCKKVPECNSAWMDTFIRKFNNIDISIAVATENGLITPIIFNADQKGLFSISSDVNSLAQKARTNKLQPHEFQGGTFTISNLGMFGIESFAAVINPPQGCILAVGGAEKRVIPDDKNGLRVATFMQVTLSADHRVVDGAVGAKWLEHFRKFMENPASMLL